ncbi:PREDICTED: uncharacterized protein LOC104821131 isoform X2 [Tarenaya hassleriana]|uniref:uncharacterized protein LOC104821131 isoform X2 n=1 Tax=Tarenaya hassleriana TaxID=28532 RepID=UPI00053C7AD1|nr:PREDICTED: uncharacterized protein LOC104821131 isoform X2 [Tarenaya hassleriana]
MKSFLSVSTAPQIRSSQFLSLSRRNPIYFTIKIPSSLSLSPRKRRCAFVPICSSSTPQKPLISKGSLDYDGFSQESIGDFHDESPENFRVQVGSPSPSSILRSAKLSLSDQAFFLLAFIACTTSVAFTSLVITAIPTLNAMGRAATSLAKLADTAREELPSTMAAIRLSGMEISDLTLELNDLSHEIADGVNKSTQAVQAAEAGIKQIGVLARQQTMSMIQERASLPAISLQPVVSGAAKKTSRAVRQATKTLLNIIAGGGDNEEDSSNV